MTRQDLTTLAAIIGRHEARVLDATTLKLREAALSQLFYDIVMLCSQRDCGFDLGRFIQAVAEARHAATKKV